MDEYIKREVVREVMYHNQEPLTEYQLNDIPGADVAPVVRCKDCKYFNNAAPNDKGFLICPASNMEIAPDDFCRYGAREEAVDG